METRDTKQYHVYDYPGFSLPMRDGNYETHYWSEYGGQVLAYL